MGLKFKRNKIEDAFSITREEAMDFLRGKIFTTPANSGDTGDGEIILSRYQEDGGIKTLVGVCHSGSTKAGMTVFEGDITKEYIIGEIDRRMSEIDTYTEGETTKIEATGPHQYKIEVKVDEGEDNMISYRNDGLFVAPYYGASAITANGNEIVLNFDKYNRQSNLMDFMYQTEEGLCANISLTYDSKSQELYISGYDGRSKKQVGDGVSMAEFLKDSMLESVELVESTEEDPISIHGGAILAPGFYMVFTWNTGHGETNPLYLNMSKWMEEMTKHKVTEGSGITISDEYQVSVDLSDDEDTRNVLFFQEEPNGKVKLRASVRNLSDAIADLSFSISKLSGDTDSKIMRVENQITGLTEDVNGRIEELDRKIVELKDEFVQTGSTLIGEVDEIKQDIRDLNTDIYYIEQNAKNEFLSKISGGTVSGYTAFDKNVDFHEGLYIEDGKKLHFGDNGISFSGTTNEATPRKATNMRVSLDNSQGYSIIDKDGFAYDRDADNAGKSIRLEDKYLMKSESGSVISEIEKLNGEMYEWKDILDDDQADDAAWLNIGEYTLTPHLVYVSCIRNCEYVDTEGGDESVIGGGEAVSDVINFAVNEDGEVETYCLKHEGLFGYVVTSSKMLLYVKNNKVNYISWKIVAGENENAKKHGYKESGNCTAIPSLNSNKPENGKNGESGLLLLGDETALYDLMGNKTKDIQAIITTTTTGGTNIEVPLQYNDLLDENGENTNIRIVNIMTHNGKQYSKIAIKLDTSSFTSYPTTLCFRYLQDCVTTFELVGKSEKIIDSKPVARCTEVYILIEEDNNVTYSLSQLFEEYDDPSWCDIKIWHTFLNGNIDSDIQMRNEGYMVCDGRSLTKDEYPDLYKVIGRTYTPTGTDNSLFCLPDLRGLFILGAAGQNNTIKSTNLPPHVYNGTDFDSDGQLNIPILVGKTGGCMTVTMDDISQMPRHSHSVTTYTEQTTTVDGSATSTQEKSVIKSLTKETQNVGNEGVNNKNIAQYPMPKEPNRYNYGMPAMPPYMTMCYIIRTKKPPVLFKKRDV